MKFKPLPIILAGTDICQFGSISGTLPVRTPKGPYAGLLPGRKLALPKVSSYVSCAILAKNSFLRLAAAI